MIYLVSNQTELFDVSHFSIISLEESIDILKNLNVIALDTETSGLDPHTKKLLLLQLGNEEIQVLFDIASFNYSIPNSLKFFLNTHKALYVIQNAKFDLKFLFKQDVILRSIYDTMLAETILTNGLTYDGRDLATLAMKYCGAVLDKSIRGRIISLGLSTPVLLYGANDIKYLIAIKDSQEVLIKKENLSKALELDNSFVIVLAYIEFCGIKLDFQKWLANTVTSKAELYGIKKELEDKVFEDGYSNYFSGMLDMFDNTISCLINWNSPKQVMKLFKEYGIKVYALKKGKKIESIDAKVLLPQVDKFPMLSLYLKYKELQKELSTYGESWAKYINPLTGRVHSSYKQINDTGRLSSGSKYDNTPNMQNIPAEYKFRSCFIPEKDNIMIDADYSGQETIVLANLSQESNLINFYERGLKDMHSFVAFLMYKDIRICDVDHVTNEALEYVKNNFKDKRQIAKSAGSRLYKIINIFH